LKAKYDFLTTSNLVTKKYYPTKKQESPLDLECCKELPIPPKFDSLADANKYVEEWVKQK
jgi:hypothetical protein